MKLSILSSVLFIGIAFNANAQQEAISNYLHHNRQQRVYETQFANQIQTSAIDYTNQTDLRLLNTIKSKVGYHYFYQQYFNGLPIHGAFVKINTNPNGKVLSTFKSTINSAQFYYTSPNKNSTHWLIADQQLIAAQKTIQGHQTIFIGSNGETLYSKDNRLFFTDTIIKAKVFKPDPLTTAGVIYGQNGTYRHFNDSDYALLNNERVEVMFPATYDNGTFILENKYAKITDLRGPQVAPANSTNDTFYFTRKQDGFKDVMALYHISNLQQYLQSLGHNNLANFQLKVDAHALTADQSYFTYDSDTSLNFGLGGVPDAEDADVIVHEYTHAICFSINPDGISNTERRALEEGLCDVVSCAYSKRMNPFNWKKVFNWDGQNEFWPGRNGGSSKTYLNKQNDWYNDSEIWSSALNEIIDYIGEDKVIDLLVSAIPSFTPFTTMPEAAQIMYDLDSVLYDGNNRGFLSMVFNARKLGNFPVGLNHYQLTNVVDVINSAAFANNTGHVQFINNDQTSIEIEVTDLKGNLVVKKQALAEISLNPAEFESGMYVVRINTSKGQGTYKLARF